ncbi:MAG: L-threonylcarbamoyladenylate synthase [bacterium]
MEIKGNIYQCIIQKIREGGIGVLPTDTIYGIVGSALLPNTIERVYVVRKRRLHKPFIILLDDIKSLRHFNVRITESERRFLKTVWPGEISVILPCPYKKYEYVHRGTKTLAFRIPNPKWLRSLIGKTGPLVAPSANFEGFIPAATITEAKKYFGKTVDFYVSAGRRLQGEPSTVVTLQNGKVIVLRQGTIKVKNNTDL